MNWVGMLLPQDSFRGADFLGVFRMAKGVGIAEGCACIRISRSDEGK